jgi:hypothetical protein
MTSKAGLLPLPFAGGFYLSRSKPFSSQRCINWYPNYSGSNTLNPENLFHCSGLREVTNTGAGICRGMLVMNNRLYTVNGNGLYRINRVVNPDLTVTYTPQYLGFIAGVDRVQMDASRNQLAIVVPGLKSYICEETAGSPEPPPSLSEITDPDFNGPAQDVAFLDSFFVFFKSGTNEVFHSQPNDGLSYSALDIYPVPQLTLVKGLGVYRNQLYVFGESITVPFNNVGGLQFAFLPIPNAVIDTGLATQNTKTKFRQSFVWLGSGENAEVSVWLYAGGAPQKISTEPIDYLLQNMAEDDIRRAFMLRHSQNGAEFIVLNIGDYCLKYDLAASSAAGQPIWHEQRSRVPAGDDFVDASWRVNAIAQAYNKVFVGDAVDGRIGEIADDLGTEYGINMACLLDTGPLSNMGLKSKVWAIEVFTDVGVDADDVMNLSWSDDGGFTYGNKLARSLGAVGEYGRRVIWSRLGAFSIARKLRIEYSGKYPRGINKLQANAQ